MRIPRLYVESQLELGKPHVFGREQSHYIRQVLRLPLGAEVCLFDGSDQEFSAQLQNDPTGKLCALPESARRPNTESPLHTLLVQSISRGERMDYCLQKATELGVSAIQPIFSEFCVVQLDGKRLEKREQHWRGVIQSAAEQCGRTKIPLLLPALDYSTWLSRFDPTAQLGILLDPDSPTPLMTHPIRHQACAFLIGPEGGFSEAEIIAAKNHGLIGLSLGPRILRTETVAAVVLSLLQAKCGDLR